MEAPEKVYRTTTYHNSERGNTVWKNHPVAGAENVEYIRKDAFIEKACNFIDERLNFDDNAWYIEGEVTVKDKVIEDFKNYMKGE